MTPKRKAYLNTCSQEELWLRLNIANAKSKLSIAKAMLNPKAKVENTRRTRRNIKLCKFKLAVYRTALSRFKGCKPYLVAIPSGLEIIKLWRCSVCGEAIGETDKFCSRCGSRIAWRG